MIGVAYWYACQISIVSRTWRSKSWHKQPRIFLNILMSDAMQLTLFYGRFVGPA